MEKIRKLERAQNTTFATAIPSYVDSKNNAIYVLSIAQVCMEAVLGTAASPDLYKSLSASSAARDKIYWMWVTKWCWFCLHKIRGATDISTYDNLAAIYRQLFGDAQRQLLMWKRCGFIGSIAPSTPLLKNNSLVLLLLN